MHRSSGEDTGGMRPSQARDGAVLAGLVAIVGACAWTLRDVRNDDAYITYRYAQNLLDGRGLVFNPGEAVLATTAPGHALFLATGGLVSADLVVVALVLSAAALVALAWSSYAVLRDAGSHTAGLVAAALVALAPATYELFPLETILVGACVLVGLRCAQRRHALALGVVAGVAVTIRADAILAFAAIGFVMAAERVPWRDWARTLGAAAIVAAPWFVFATIAYGGPMPSTAGTKTGWPGHLDMYGGKLVERGLVPLFGLESTTWIAVPIAIVGFVAILRDARWSAVRAVLLWAVLHALAYTGLRILWPHHWYYHPITLAFAVGTAVGGVVIARAVAARTSASARAGRAAAVLVLGAIALSDGLGVLSLRERIPTEFFLGGRDALYRDAAAWMCAHTAPDERIALAEPGTLAYHCDRPVVDMMGLVTPEIGVAMKERRKLVDTSWVIEHYAPEMFLLIPPTSDGIAPVLPGAPEYALAAAFERDGVDRRVLIYRRTRAS
jgi:arabinofuranosyltransferase